VSPIYAQRSALGAVIGPQFGWFCISVATVFLLSCAMLATASWLVPRSWQDGARPGFVELVGEKIRSLLRRIIPARSKAGAALLDSNPFEWLAIRDQSLRTAMVLAIAACVFLAVALHPILSLYWEQSGFSLLVSLPIVFVLLIIFKVRVGRLAVRHIAGAKENGVLEFIMGSRVRMEEIVSAQFRALWNLLGWPLLALGGVYGAALVYSWSAIDRLADTFTSPPEIGEYRLRAVIILGVVLLFLFLDSIALTWTGMLCAFKISRTGKAHSWTGFLALAVPLGLYLVAIPTLLQFSRIRPYIEAFYPLVALWVTIKLGTDLLLIAYARAWLLRAARLCIHAPVEQTREDRFFISREALRQMLKSNLAFLTRSVGARSEAQTKSASSAIGTSTFQRSSTSD